ncbi:MAG: PPC domain-containing protein [Gemmataceae bacterium]|nr:PPC domain-containing protein [Gemmata sp.]MDW8198411.1 PPC domain-containing protein [Gemmataceae bacterium]
MRRRMFGFLLAAGCLAVADPVGGQPPPGLPSPRLQQVFPSGLKAGTTVEVTVTGFDLEEPEQLLFSHPGLTGKYLPPPKDPQPDPKDPKKTIPPPKVNPAGPHKFQVTATADVPVGLYDVRFVGKWGVSNPRALVVSDQAEVNEQEPNNDVTEAQKIAVGTVVNGVIANPTDVDYCSFPGRKGQRVIISCLASSIDSKATPLVEVFDPSGRRLAANRNYRDTDALVDVILPADGDYLVRVCQFTYTAGGADYFYRLSVTTAPWIDAVFPPAVEVGKTTEVTLLGRNLPNGKPSEFTLDGRPLEQLTVSVTPPPDAAAQLTSATRIDPATALQDGFSYTLRGSGGTSNPVVIYLARAKLTVRPTASPGPNDAVVPVPGEVAGRLSPRGQKDWIAFNAKKGERFLIELTAERIGSSGDFYFSIRDGKDPQRDLSGELDDDNDSLHPFIFFTRNSDPPVYSFTAPEDGKYYVVIGSRDTQAISGPTSAYRLRIGPPQPDFRAVIMPHGRLFQTGSAAWPGGTEAYWLFVHRIDGYTGELQVAVEGLPSGVTAAPLTIGPAARWGLLVLSVAPNAAQTTTPWRVKVTGTTPSGQKLTRTARSASVIWGLPQPDANSPVVARLDRTLVLAVRGEKAPFTLTADVANATIRPASGQETKANGPRVVLKQGEKASIPIKADWSVPEKPNVTLVAEPLVPQPQNAPFTVQFPAQPTKDKPDVLVNLDVRPNALPGTYSLVIRGTAAIPFQKDPQGKQKQPVPVDAFTTPITIRILPTAVAKLTVTNLPNNTLKVGEKGELGIKVERQYDYRGEFKVKLELPAGTTGITATEVTIPANQDEVKLPLQATADAKPGPLANATITVTAMYAEQYPVVHEAKITVNIVADPKKK